MGVSWLLRLLQLGTYGQEHVPAWRRPLVGYIAALFIVLFFFLGFVFGWFVGVFIPAIYMSTLLILSVTCIAFFWGAGPSVCTLILGTILTLDLYVEPIGSLSLGGADGDFSFTSPISILLFIVTGTIISLMVYQRERASIRAMHHEQELRQSQQQMEEFIGIICHELRTPLTAIQGSLQLAERKLQRKVFPEVDSDLTRDALQNVQRYLSQAMQQVGVQTRLVGDLLDASRVQRQNLKVVLERSDLLWIVRNSVEHYQTTVPSRVIQFESTVQQPLWVEADADRLQQVLTNYLSNALKYSPVEKPVRVTLELIDDTIARVSVHDKGPGLPIEEHERIWRRFYRSPKSVAQQNSGVPNVSLGVGLALCKAIVAYHNGHVGVDSVPGHGATFWFTVPLKSEALVSYND